jgi:hypothetical protein
MTIHTTKKSSSLNSNAKHCPTQEGQSKSNVSRQSHKINPLYETPFQDVVTCEYVRGYN